ncbi:MAG TPA: hypothetical protein VGG02_06630 [Chthoniobacterales bacterium]|jgi:hypothetical protein
MKIPVRTRGFALSRSRWSAYLAAAAASAIHTAAPAEAEIHYSGIVESKFDSGKGPITRSFPLSGGVSILGFHFGSQDHVYGDASFGIKGAAVSNQLVGNGNIFPLPRGTVVSQRRFFSPADNLALLQSYLGSGDFHAHGIYYIGFRFNKGAGEQVGWARIRWGDIPRCNFILIDYAWGDVGDKIETGQKSSDGNDRVSDQVDSQGSLGLLALGAVGVAAWRAQRQQEKMPGDF